MVIRRSHDHCQYCRYYRCHCRDAIREKKRNRLHIRSTLVRDSQFTFRDGKTPTTGTDYLIVPASQECRSACYVNGIFNYCWPSFNSDSKRTLRFLSNARRAAHAGKLLSEAAFAFSLFMRTGYIFKSLIIILKIVRDRDYCAASCAVRERLFLSVEDHHRRSVQAKFNQKPGFAK